MTEKETVDEARWTEWRRTVNGKTYGDPVPREIPETPMQVRFEAPVKPSSCGVCGRRLGSEPASLGDLCWVHYHGAFHMPGCGCPADPWREV